MLHNRILNIYNQIFIDISKTLMEDFLSFYVINYPLVSREKSYLMISYFDLNYNKNYQYLQNNFLNN